MKTYARIDDGVVAELFTTELSIAELFSPELVWVDCIGTACQVGWLFANGVFDPPPEPFFADLKAIEINRWMELREKMFSRLNNIERRLAASGDTAGAASCITVSTSLLGLFTATTVTSATTMPALTAALKARYAEAVAVATATARAEFKKYDK